jgi:hypothetical protein
MMRNAKRRQTGVALMLLLAVFVLGSSAYLISRLNAESASASAIRKARNAEVLNRAKQALIGYVAAQAANIAEDNPGSLPCPEAAGYYDNPAQEGQSAGTCTLPKVGRFPWRTIGTEKLLDSMGEPLWYVVSPGWAVPNSTTKTTGINSNALGQLTVDGVANAAVALIIAPGRAFSVPACGANPAISQNRPTTGTPDWRNYLECENATYPTPDAVFVTSGAADSFNDQVMRVTAADLMPGIEAAIAKRIERSVIPALQTVYTPATWGFAGTAPVTVNPVLPFAAPFANPGPGAGTSDYIGATGTYSGLLPFNEISCTQSAANPRCTLPVFAKSASDVLTAGSGTIRTQSTCSWQANDFVCIGEYLQPNIAVTVQIKAYVATGLRTTTQTFPWTANSPANFTFTAMNDTTGGWGTQSIPYTVTASALGSDGSITFTIAGTSLLPDIATAGWGTYANYRVSINKAIFGDHAMLSTTDPDPCPSYGCTGWFARNEWYRLLYYAVSQGNTAAQLAQPPALRERSCTTPGNCISVASSKPTTLNSALLILSGRSVNGTARPNSTLSNYLESGNATGTYTQNKFVISTTAPDAQRFNDRLIGVASN